MADSTAGFFIMQTCCYQCYASLTKSLQTPFLSLVIRACFPNALSNSFISQSGYDFVSWMMGFNIIFALDYPDRQIGITVLW